MALVHVWIAFIDLTKLLVPNSAMHWCSVVQGVLQSLLRRGLSPFLLCLNWNCNISGVPPKQAFCQAKPETVKKKVRACLETILVSYGVIAMAPAAWCPLISFDLLNPPGIIETLQVTSWWWLLFSNRKQSESVVSQWFTPYLTKAYESHENRPHALYIEISNPPATSQSVISSDKWVHRVGWSINSY